MMKKTLIGFALAIVTISTVAFMRSQNNGIIITGGFGGEPKLQFNQSDQTVDWIMCVSNGIPVFELPASGVVPVSYGGTGVKTVAALQALITNAPNSGITAIANGGTGTNTLAGIRTLGLNSGLTATNDTTWFDAKGAAAAVTGNNITFTNAAGASFKMIVNTSTNGFTFVAQ